MAGPALDSSTDRSELQSPGKYCVDPIAKTGLMAPTSADPVSIQPLLEPTGSPVERFLGHLGLYTFRQPGRLFRKVGARRRT